MSVARFTIAGADGFIGGRLRRWLADNGIPVEVLVRGDAYDGRPLGRLIWCAGVVRAARERPLDTVAAHVGDLLPLLRSADFDALVYLSSTAVYEAAASGAEDTPLVLRHGGRLGLYKASKILGEMTCLESARTGVAVARLSTVYATDGISPDLVTALARAAARDGCVTLRSGPGASKDYVHVDDVLPALAGLAELATAGAAKPIYNIASGVNTSLGELAAQLHRLTGCDLKVLGSEDEWSFPEIAIERGLSDLRLRRRSVVDELAQLVSRV